MRTFEYESVPCCFLAPGQSRGFLFPLKTLRVPWVSLCQREMGGEEESIHSPLRRRSCVMFWDESARLYLNCPLSSSSYKGEENQRIMIVFQVVARHLSNGLAFSWFSHVNSPFSKRLEATFHVQLEFPPFIARAPGAPGPSLQSGRPWRWSRPRAPKRHVFASNSWPIKMCFSVFTKLFYASYLKQSWQGKILRLAA